MVLVNTIHFKVPWEIPFEPEETRDSGSYTLPGEPMRMTVTARPSSVASISSIAIFLPTGRKLQHACLHSKSTRWAG